MTISADYAPNIDLGNGTTLAFAVNFPFGHAADVLVTLFDTASSADVIPAPMLNGTDIYDYIVSGTPDTGTGIYPNGTVIFNTAPPGGVQVIRARDTAQLQELVLIDNARFPAKSVEGALDREEMQIQELASTLDRAVVAPISDSGLDMTLPPVSERAGKLAAYDAAGRFTYTEDAGGADDTLRADLASSAPAQGTNLLGLKLQYPNSAIITLHDWVEALPVNARGWGVLANGTDMSVKLSQAVADLQNAGGGEMVLPRGTITLNGIAGADGKKNGILVPYKGYPNLDGHVAIKGQGKSTVLKAGATGLYIIRLCDSYCTIADLSLDGAGLANVSGLGVVPADIHQTTSLVFQIFNHVRNLEIRSCVEGVELTCGPAVGGAASGCWYNRFYDFNIFSCTRGIWLRSGPCGTSISGVNRCTFHGGRVGQVPSNTGVQIDSGIENRFQLDFEGILTGPSPNATPTGIKIPNLDSYGGGNNSNSFVECTFESVTRHVDNANPYTGFYDCTWDAFLSQLGALPLNSIGGEPPNTTPLILSDRTIVFASDHQLDAFGYIAGTLYLGGTAATTGVQVGTAIYRTAGKSGSIANGSTFQIFMPADHKCYELAITHDVNPLTPHLSVFATDGVSNVTPTILAAGGVTLSITGLTITVINNTTATAIFTWALLQRTR